MSANEEGKKENRLIHHSSGIEEGGERKGVGR